MNPEKYTLALPSKGAIAEPTHDFLRQIGLKVSKPNPRQYTGYISQMDNLQVLFQRVKDVVYKVSDGTAHLGITGLDVVYENYHEDVIIIHGELGYGHCQLVVAVPESWADVNDINDLAEVALDFREQKGRNIRVATTYPYLTRQFLQKQRIQHFQIVRAEGAIEAAPTIGSADFVVDLTQTGTTLRENHLKQIKGGTIIEAQACLIGHRPSLLEKPVLLDSIQYLCEFIDAGLNARHYYQATFDIIGNDIAHIVEEVVKNPLTSGTIAPTVSPIYHTGGERWHTLTITIGVENTMAAVRYLRTLGADNIIINPIKYVFRSESNTFKRLLEKLDGDY